MGIKTNKFPLIPTFLLFISQKAYRSYIKDKQKSPFSTMSSNRSYSTLSISKKIRNIKKKMIKIVPGIIFDGPTIHFC